MLPLALEAYLLSDSLRDDRYFQCFFRDGSLGDLARTLFFLDEVRMRRRHGLVIQSREAVALVGLPPRPYLEACDLSHITRMLIDAQGRTWRHRWSDALAASVRSNREDFGTAYLSAIACAPRWRRRGVATSLLRRVQAATSERGLQLECEVATPQLRGWYEGRGFKCVGTSPLPDGRELWRMAWYRVPQRASDGY